MPSRHIPPATPCRRLRARRSSLAGFVAGLALLPALVAALLPPPAAAVDYAPDGVPSLGDSTLNPGQQVSFTDLIQNIGSAPVFTSGGSNKVTHHFSTDSTISSGDAAMRQVSGTGDCGFSFSYLPPDRSSTFGITCILPDTVTRGATYYLGFCITATLDTDTNTNNDCSAGVAVVVNQPNLAVGNVTVNDDTVLPGQTISISVASVRHDGQGDATAASTLRYYWSTSATISGTDTPLGTDAVPSLAAGASVSLSEAVTVPSPLTLGGTYYVGVCVDTVSDEADTSDNCSAGIPVSFSDFDWTVVAGSVSIDDATLKRRASPSPLAPPCAMWGEWLAGATTLRFYWSTDSSVSTTDTQLCAVAVPSLDSDSFSALSATTCAVPASATAGDYYVGACVDTQSGEQHSGDSDNCSAGISVSVSGFDWIVVAGSVSIDATTLKPGQSIALAATVRNVGGEAASTTTLSFHWSTDTVVTSADTQLCAVAVPSLDSDSGGTLSAACAVPAAAEDGDYHVGACVDTQSGEESVANNCSAGIPVAVSATPLDVDENASVDAVDATLVLRVLLLPESIRALLLAGDASVAGLVVAGFPALAANEAAIVGLAVELGAQGAGSDMDVDLNGAVDSVDATLALRVLLLPDSIRALLLAGDAAVAGLAVAGFPALAANEAAIVRSGAGPHRQLARSWSAAEAKGAHRARRSAELTLAQGRVEMGGRCSCADADAALDAGG